LPIISLLLITLFFAGTAFSEFIVTNISDTALVNREPTVSDLGIVAWSAYSQTDAGELASDIVIYTSGVRRTITQAKPESYMANIRPVAQSNVVVWIATFKGMPGKPDWILKDVPKDALPPLNLASTGGPSANVAADTNLPSSATGTNATPVEIAPDAAAAAQAAALPRGPAVAEEIIEPDLSAGSPQGTTEICLWRGESGFDRITHDGRDDVGPSVWGSLIAWQKAKGWPFGWEIMIWSEGVQQQLTTNLYYDMGPKVQGQQLVWYGWDGHDFEIFLYDNAVGVTTQLTNNGYDDVSPSIWEGQVAWEAYPGADAEIFLWKDGKIRKISDNIEDDTNPKIWNGKVVWQGFDGDDFEIYLFDGSRTIKLTSNTYDDTNPDIRDNIICWTGYHDNWDAEIFVWDGKEVSRLTANEVEDREPRTAGGRIVWQSDTGEKTQIYLAEPKQ